VRITLVALGCAAILAPGVGAQNNPQLHVQLGRTATPEANIVLRGLLTDQRFLSAMESGFPLYLEYRAELRQSRSLWDRTVAAERWEYVVLYDPVRERFVIEDAAGTEILPTRASLREKIAEVYLVGLLPDREGEFYYQASVDARTLSDDDVNEVFAWLKGENIDSLPRQRPGLLTRVARRFLVRVAPLPRLHLEGRSQNFRHP
jgi:hypothetical protein